MLITAVQIKRLPNTETRLHGIADLTLDDMLVIHDIKIIRTQEGFFCAMPSKEIHNDVFYDIVHPINRETRHAFEKIILSAYDQCIASENLLMRFTLNELYLESDFKDLDIAFYDIDKIVPLIKDFENDIAK